MSKYKFSNRSKARLETCHPDLQELFNEVIKYYDCTVLCGHRDEEDQNEAFRAGHSKLRFPQSKHNTYPSLAIDVVPYPIDWADRGRFLHFAGFVLGLSKTLGLSIRCGVDFNEDLNFQNDSFFDAPHFELKRVKEIKK